MTNRDLNIEIEKGKYNFEGVVFDSIINYSNDSFKKIKRIEFEYCTFNGGFVIEEENFPELSILFKECIFKNRITIYDVQLNNLLFVNLKSITSIDVSGTFNRIRFNNSNLPLKGNINFNSCNVLNELNFENFNQEEGNFSLEVNRSLKDSISDFKTFFKNASFDNLEIFDSNFGDIANFKKIKVSNNLEISNSNFKECNFDGSLFLGEVNLNKCEFYYATSFQNIVTDIHTDFKIFDSIFYKTANFNNSSIVKLKLEDNYFKDIAFFQETLFNNISIDRTFFEKGALFDDIRIAKINNCNRRTLRTIKLQLQKAENKIDYNRFRVYEFDAYKKDIKRKIKNLEEYNYPWDHRNNEANQLKRDLFVLNISEIVSDYGTDWKRALKFTLLSGFIAFTFFFIIENISKTVNLNNWQDFIYGYFRFFLITDFKNEYYETGESILKFNCVLSLIPFIIGKIVIAFGIYEMIQSFRKFKA